MKHFTDEEVEVEIERLKNNDFVKLAKKEEAVRCRRRNYMYSLRNYERKGKELSASGVTIEMLEELLAEIRLAEASPSSQTAKE